MSIADIDADAALVRAENLAKAWEGYEPAEILERAVHREFGGKIAMVSSFGAESAVLLARRHGVEMPISEQVHAVLEGRVKPAVAVGALLARDVRVEGV
mgnify:CR=1 FL=1